MKRAGAALCTALAVVFMMTTAAFGLEITGISPKDGSKGYQPQNMAIKVTFDEPMAGEEAAALNKDKFSVKAPDGTEVPYEITYSAKKYPNQLWIVLSEDLKSDTKYTFTAKAGIASLAGDELSKPVTTVFGTRNVKTDTMVSMGLTVVMMVLMFYMTSKAMKKANAEKADPIAAEKAAIAKMNPYKLAKDKKISLEAAQVLIEKAKAKSAKKIAKLEEQKEKHDMALKAEMKKIEADIIAAEEAARHAANYHVKRPGSVKAAGGKIPRSVIRANKEKRAAAEKKAKDKEKQDKKKR